MTSSWASPRRLSETLQYVPFFFSVAYGCQTSCCDSRLVSIYIYIDRYIIYIYTQEGKASVSMLQKKNKLSLEFMCATTLGATCLFRNSYIYTDTHNSRRYLFSELLYMYIYIYIYTYIYIYIHIYIYIYSYIYI